MMKGFKFNFGEDLNMKKEKNFLQKIISAIREHFSAALMMDAASDVMYMNGDRLSVGNDKLHIGKDILDISNDKLDVGENVANGKEATRVASTSKASVRVEPLKKLTVVPNRSSEKGIENAFMPAFKR